MPIERGDRTMRPRGKKVGPPPKHRRGQADGRDRMTEIVLAVPERPLAVLPRLPPVDRRQGHEDDVFALRHRRPITLIEGTALLEDVPLCVVVVHGGSVGQARERTADDVGLGRMEVAARRIDAQRPSRRSEDFPRRQPERMAEEIADGAGGNRRARGRSRSNS